MIPNQTQDPQKKPQQAPSNSWTATNSKPTGSPSPRPGMLAMPANQPTNEPTSPLAGVKPRAGARKKKGIGSCFYRKLANPNQGFALHLNECLHMTASGSHKELHGHLDVGPRRLTLWWSSGVSSCPLAQTPVGKRKATGKYFILVP